MGLAAALAAPRPASARPTGLQPPPDSDYQRVALSIVRIKTIAQVERPAPDPISGLPSTRRSPLVAYGTGIVIDSLRVDGRLEYVILTNYHVADLRILVKEYARKLEERRARASRAVAVESRSYVAFPADRDVREHVIRLVEIAHDESGDMALLRTVNADRALSVYPYEIGFRDGEVPIGASVITTGFTLGGRLITAQGVVTGVRAHSLGVPHADFTLSVPVEPGQSGSPVFLIDHGPYGVRYVLIGLLHAREHGEPFVVPYSLWRGTLCRIEAGQRRSRHCKS